MLSGTDERCLGRHRRLENGGHPPGGRCVDYITTKGGSFMDDEYPHTNAFTRLAPSGIAGIGVFAIRDIPQGTNIFPNDKLGIRWIDHAAIDDVDEASAELYAEFAI